MHELVVDGLFDIHALYRYADLPGVGEPAPHRGVDGPVDVGVGTDDHRVLAPELQAVWDQSLRGRGGDAAPGVDRSGEHQVVHGINQRGTGFTKTIDYVKYVRRPELLPSIDRGLPRERRTLPSMPRGYPAGAPTTGHSMG